MSGRASVRRVESTFSVPAGLPLPSLIERMFSIFHQTQAKKHENHRTAIQQTFALSKKLGTSLAVARGAGKGPCEHSPSANPASK